MQAEDVRQNWDCQVDRRGRTRGHAYVNLQVSGLTYDQRQTSSKHFVSQACAPGEG
jgi:hypothetical protein